MKGKYLKIFSFIGFSVLFVVVVIAATLVNEMEVDLCHDFDNGVNTDISSSTIYSKPGDWGWMYDNCKDASTLVEYACRTDAVLNKTYFQTWEENCTCVNGACQ